MEKATRRPAGKKPAEPVETEEEKAAREAAAAAAAAIEAERARIAAQEAALAERRADQFFELQQLHARLADERSKAASVRRSRDAFIYPVFHWPLSFLFLSSLAPILCQDMEARAEWARFLACENTPDPRSEQQINEFLTVWRDEPLAEIVNLPLLLRQARQVVACPPKKKKKEIERKEKMKE